MFGLLGKIKVISGKREELATILVEGTREMPGCLSYIVALDASDDDALIVTEVWESQAHHQASLELPAVQAAIQKGRPLIAGMENIATTTPVGGHGMGKIDGRSSV